MSEERKIGLLGEAATVVDFRMQKAPEALEGTGDLPQFQVPPHAARMLDQSPQKKRDEDTAPRIGEYALVARFPSSASADVFLGYKVTPFGIIRRAVVKWTDRRRHDYPLVRQTLLDEARAISFVDHPNIVAVLDFNEDHAGTYLALEYVAGTDLRRVLAELTRRSARMPVIHACYLVAEVARALQHVHSARGPDGTPFNIVHRDVNPSNLLVSEDGHVRLTDFGTVLMDGRAQDKTAPGMVKGKVRYLAPEYIAEQQCTFRVDLYSLGVVLFEMLTGQPVFLSPNNTQAMIRIVREGLPYQHLAATGLPPTLLNVVYRATAREPNDRYGSAAEMCHALEDWMSSAGLFTSPSRFSTYLHAEGLFV